MVKKESIINEFKNLIEDLKKDIAIHQAKGEKKEANALTFKIRSFQKAIKSLEGYSKNDITSTDEIKDLNGIGKGTITRIDKIIKDGHLDSKTFVEKDLKIVQNVNQLESVSGIGPSHASQLIKSGITLEKLLSQYKLYQNMKIKKEDSAALKDLTHHQLLGLKYYHQFQERIPRNKIKKFEDKLRKIIDKYQTYKKLSLKWEICGSYRRGCVDSGDIDLLVTTTTDTDMNLVDFVNYLNTEGLIIDRLTDKGNTKFMGVIEGGHRLDIRYVHKDSYGTALLYFTGSKTFNTLVRAKALKMGYTLEEYGLYSLLDYDQGKKASHSHQHRKGEKKSCLTEKSVFETLKIDMKYLDPTNRDLKDNITSL